MRRVCIIGLAWVMCAASAAAQLRSIFGELRYQHQYQDILSGGSLSTALRQSPLFSLQTTGTILSPQLATFDLRTAMAWDLGRGRSRDQSYSTRQFYWDSYDLNLALIQYSPVKVNCSIRENLLKTRSDNGFAEALATSVRRQEQRFSASTYRISTLPSTTAGYDRIRTFSTMGDPFDQVVERFSLGMSTANGSSAMSVSGGISRLHERITGVRNTYSNVQFTANKDFTEENRLDLTADYDRYDDYSTMGATAGFNGVVDETVRLFSSVFGRNSTSRTSTSMYYGASQGVQVTADEHWQVGGSLSAHAGLDTRKAGDADIRERTFDWAGTASAQHSRETVIGTMQNTANVSYTRQKIRGDRQILAGTLANGLSQTFGSFSLGLGYGISGGVAVNGTRRYSVGNTGNFSLIGSFPNRLSTQTTATYNDERYTGDVGYFRNRRTLMARQGFSMPGVLVIPYSIGGGASVTWYLAGIRGKAYGWYASFSSGYFFVQGLSATYLYNRTYDPYYLRESVEQTAEFRYQWRALTFELKAREYRLVDRRREVWFSVSRPFSL